MAWTSVKTEKKQDQKENFEYKKGKGNCQEDKNQDKSKFERCCMNGRKSMGRK
jgi:hypothetical protein